MLCAHNITSQYWWSTYKIHPPECAVLLLNFEKYIVTKHGIEKFHIVNLYKYIPLFLLLQTCALLVARGFLFAFFDVIVSLFRMQWIWWIACIYTMHVMDVTKIQSTASKMYRRKIQFITYSSQCEQNTHTHYTTVRHIMFSRLHRLPTV